MQTCWDLSYLYTGFDDPAFAADLEALKSGIASARTALEAVKDDKEFLKAFIAENEAISTLMDKLFSYCELTLSADASNAQAEKYLDQVVLLSNDMSLLSSSVIRRLGSMNNLDQTIASLPEAGPCAFALREMADQAHHSIPEAIEPWILKMQLSGGSAFSMLRNKLDATHLVEYRGESLPLSAVRGLPILRMKASEKMLMTQRLPATAKWKSPWLPASMRSRWKPEPSPSSRDIHLFWT